MDEIVQRKLRKDEIDQKKNNFQKIIHQDATTQEVLSELERTKKINEKMKLAEQTKTTVIRGSEGKVWNDPSLSEWPEADFRIMVSDLSVSAKDNDLKEAFGKYKSLAKVRVIRDSSGRGKQYGFVSLLDVKEYIDAMQTMQKTFIGNKRVTLQASKWKSKSLE